MKKLTPTLFIILALMLVPAVTGTAIAQKNQAAQQSQATGGKGMMKNMPPSGMMGIVDQATGQQAASQPGQAGGQGMMGSGGMGPDMMHMMDKGMMPMMMSHMQGGKGGMGRMMGRMGGPACGIKGLPGMVRMLDNLNLTDEQWDKVRTLAKQQLDTMADLWAQRMKVRIDLAGLRWDKDVDPKQVKELFQKKAEAQAEMFLAGMDYIKGVKAILTPEQLKQFEAE